MVLIGTLVFLFPLVIWFRYSEAIVSSGGLYAFVEAAAGRTVARLQAVFWIASYFLYLVYTVPFITYDLLPVVFPQATAYRLLVDVALTLLVIVVMLSPLIITLLTIAAIASIQVVISLLLAGVALAHLGAPAGSFIGHGNLEAVIPAAGRTSSLYICASLPLFLGGELRGGSPALRRGLGWAFGAVAGIAILATFPLAAASASITNADIPGFSLGRVLSGRWLALLVGVGVAVSVAGLIIVEFLALSRLLAALLTRPRLQMVRVLCGLFFAGSLVSLLNPAAAYNILLKPSLIALWIAQLMVVALYPWLKRRQRQLGAADVGLAAAASAVMLFGLYSAVATSPGT